MPYIHGQEDLKILNVQFLNAYSALERRRSSELRDAHMEAKLGKKCNRQTMFLNLEDIKRAGPIKTPTPKRQSSVQSPSGHLPRESHRSSNALTDGSIDKQGLLNNKDQRPAGKKHMLISKKQETRNASYQDSSVERLHQEVTSEKFWHHPGEMELQCVPDRFESTEGYVQVFETLLFEECRA